MATTISTRSPTRGHPTRRAGKRSFDCRLPRRWTRLDVEDRALLMLVAGRGHSFSEAAEITGLPRGTIASRVSRARQSLRADLGAPTTAEEAQWTTTISRGYCSARFPSRGRAIGRGIDLSLGLIDRPDESRLNEEASDSTSIALRPGGRRRVAVVPLAIAAAVLLIAGWFAGTRIASTSDERVETGLADEPAPDAVDGDATPGPRANLDHWNAVYGVWDCTLNDGAGGWLEAFQSDKDDWGIHSHKDGLISIHPFSEEAAGFNATFRLFAESMGVVVDDDRIVLDDGRVLTDGTTCNGEPAQVHIRRWNSDLALQRDPSIPATVVTENLGAERFSNDREVWVLAFAPVTATISSATG